MAEEIKDQIENAEDGATEATEKASNQESKTVTIEEMHRRIAKEQEKHKQELEEFKASVQARIDDEVKKAKMSDDELKELAKKEQEEELANAQNRIAELEAQIATRQMQDVAISKLSEMGLPVNDETLAFVVKGNEEDTINAVQSMANILTAQKRQESNQTPPKSSGGQGKVSSNSADKFAQAKITNF